MKTNQNMDTEKPMKMKADEVSFLAVLIILELFVLPTLPLGKYGGGVAMEAVAVIGLLAYLLLFKERLRFRGQLKLFVLLAAISATAGAIIAAALCLVHWP